MEILLKLRDKIFNSSVADQQINDDNPRADNLIALGVLMWVVADADDKFLSHETEKIKEILKTYSEILDDDMPVVLRAIKEAAIMRVDLYAFTREVCENAQRPERISIIENLFRVACADQELDNEELELIRKISKLFGLDHDELIDAKVKVKKEFGLDTAGL